MGSYNVITTPPKFMRFIEDGNEVVLAEAMQPSKWHRDNKLFVYTYTKAITLKGQSFAMGLAQINELARRGRVEFKP